jgi:zinc transporter ZupT
MGGRFAFLLWIALFCVVAITAREEEHEEGEHESAVDHFVEEYGQKHWKGLTFGEFDAFFHDTVAEVQAAAPVEEEGSSGHSHSHRPAPRAMASRPKGVGAERRRRREELHCPSALDIFTHYDEDIDLVLDHAEMAGAAAELLRYVAEGCMYEEEDAADSADCRNVSLLDRWMGAIGSVLFISVVSVAGVLLLPVSSNKSSRLRMLVMSFMVSFAVGALVGDAVLHILPEVYGTDAPEWEKIGYTLMVLFGTFSFFAIEKMLHWVMDLHCLPCGRRGTRGHHDHCHGSGHSHIDVVGSLASRENLDPAPCDDHHHEHLDCEDVHHESFGHHHHHDSPLPEPLPGSKADVSLRDIEKSDEVIDPDLEQDSVNSILYENIAWPLRVFRELAMLPVHELAILFDVEVFGWLNVFGDAFHNFIDGVAIGVAFNSSFSLGIATSIAIVFHEIPQELGDFAVLIHAGFKVPVAVFLNLVVALTSVFGVFLGLGIGTASEDANVWLLAFTAGGFLYVALSDMLPELVELNSLLHMVVQFFAVWLGVASMILLLVMEIYWDLNVCGE